MRKLVPLLTLASCALFSGCGGPPPPPYNAVNVTEVSRLVNIYAVKLKYEKGLKLTDSVVYHDWRLNRVRLDFTTMNIMDLCEARELLVDLVEGLLERLNDNSIIAMDAASRPMTNCDLEIYINFESFFVEYVDPTYTGIICMKDGIVKFTTGEGRISDPSRWKERMEYYWQTRNFVNFTRIGEILYGPEEEIAVPGALEDLQIHF
ncbi:MAG: hypothetical protein WD595_05495 [Waddliaceae bacterium]